MLSIANDYFSTLFSLNGVSNPGGILVGVVPCIFDKMNDDLDKDFTYEEVCVALQSMNPLKASGEDGLGAVFYKRFWHIVGKEVAQFCIDSLKGVTILLALIILRLF
ncbi:hypothetical protein GOBAR_AA03944 [Gossypium barbadense]|uniref:Reverse transcriptase domain-containing protein n=1 Tax=Gossypium barbadense TaxID=3634 RepID=A0A2P5YM48_GOSBA|nr:hypothetical protein GOBAR_AA03944 [Gossypium barbadense]